MRLDSITISLIDAYNSVRGDRSAAAFQRLGRALGDCEAWLVKAYGAAEAQRRIEAEFSSTHERGDAAWLGLMARECANRLGPQVEDEAGRTC